MIFSTSRILKNCGLGNLRRIFPVALIAGNLIGAACAGTFGTVVAIRGHVSDIALDEGRGLLYAANFTTNRIEVISTASNTLQTPIIVKPQPSTLALSPDGRFLVIGHYTNPAAPDPALTVIDLNANTRTTLNLDGTSVLAVAFGASSQALVVTNSGVQLVDPASGASQVLTLNAFDTKGLPVPWATFPPQIVSASAGVSGDGKMIYIMWNQGTSAIVTQYDVTKGNLTLVGITSAPPLGPTAVSVDKIGNTFVTGWVLYNTQFVDLANFPYAGGQFNVGGHAFDWQRNLIYAQIPSAQGDPPVLHIVDSDNLTVRDRLQLKENLAGKSVLTGNHQTMYSVSDSGVTVLPVGNLAQTHRIVTQQEDVVFQGSGCDQRVITRNLGIVDPNGGATDFKLTLPDGISGIKFSEMSGTTPASIHITVDPANFQSQKGTTVVELGISSKSAINIPASVRLLINTRDPDQKGTLVNIPGKVVDVLADPVRNRFYALRQDKNQVLAFDGTTLKQVGVMRTGNTPVQMAITKDSHYMLVGNDNSQIASVFDLNTMRSSQPIVFPSGYYPRSIAVSNQAILATSRPAGGPPQIHRIDMAKRVATPPDSLGIYQNKIDPNAALMASPSGGVIFMAMTDGTVALYEAASDTFVASRQDLKSLGGGYAALSDDQFVVDTNVFDRALVPIGQLDGAAGSSSGFASVQGMGLRSTTPSASINGVIQRFSMVQLTSMRPVRTAESPVVALSLTTPTIGQIGETILPFTRTLAPLANGSSIVQLSTSGVLVLPSNFDTILPPPVIKAVVNSADQSPEVAPGGLISVMGSSLSSSTESTSDIPVPTALGDVCLYVNSEALPLFMVSSGQINAQLPVDIAGPANMVLTTSGGTTAPFNVNALANAPAIFRTGAGGPMIIRTVDNKFITDQTPIHLNEKLIIYVTGLGVTAPAVSTGEAGPSDPSAATAVQPTITIGGANIFTLWAGLVPGMVGVYQINAQVPFHHVPTGRNIPFTISQGDCTTTVKLRVLE